VKLRNAFIIREPYAVVGPSKGSMRSRTPILLLAAGTAAILGACTGASARPATAPGLRTVRAVGTTGPGDPGPVVADTGITVHGTGRIAGTPDVLTVSVGVQTTAAHAVDALGQNSQRAHAVIDALKANGVADKDLQTTQLSLSAHYTPGGAITGYDVSDTVTAKLRDVAKAGQAIDAAVAAAGDSGRLEGVSFSFGDDSALTAQARHDAVVRARAQAQQLADAAGVKLGALRSLAETSSTPSWPVQYATGAVAAPAAPIQAGTQELTVEVTAVYEVVPPGS
jgi:uncharacterized protein YggE